MEAFGSQKAIIHWKKRSECDGREPGWLGYSKLGLGWVGCSAVFQKPSLWKNLSGVFSVFADSCEAGKSDKTGLFVLEEGHGLVVVVRFVFFFSFFFFFIVVCSVLLSLLLIGTALGNGPGNKLIVRFVFLFNSKNSGPGVGMPLCSLRPIFIH